MTITTSPAEVRPVRRVTRSVLFALLVLPGLGWAVVRLLGWERGPLVQLMAFTPYVAAWSVLPALIALVARRWLIGAVAALAAVVLAGCVLPRAIPDADRGPAGGVPLTVMTVNLFIGDADPAAVVRLVREHDVAVLAVQEFTPRAREGLTAAGLDTLLPHRALDDEWGTTGSGLYSRFPLTGESSRRGGGGGLQDGNVHTSATVRAPGAGPLELTSAHPLAPYALQALGDWRADLEAMPRADPDGTPRIVLGDFNATLDHKPVRDLVNSGYRDAASTVGAGLDGTWATYNGRSIPPVTLDRVLVDRRIGVRKVQVLDVAGSDHRAVVASLTVPGA